MRLVLVCALVLAPVAAGAQQQGGDEPVASVDYSQWEETAKKAEAELESPSIGDARLDELRATLAQWRAALLTAQTANSARIATVKEQIAALGPTPEEGQTEAPEIAAKRQELADLLVKLQAPGIAADEAYRRADGLIREIDNEIRERQADQLLQIWPSPVNPANWPEAAVGITDTVVRLWDEASGAWDDGRARSGFFNNLPLILLLLAVAVATTVFARRWIELFADRLQGRGSEARQRVFALIASLGQVIVPVIGMVALSAALVLTGLLGDLTGAVARALPFLGVTVFVSFWLGTRVFPRTANEETALPLPPERRAEGRFLAAMMGLTVAAEMLRELLMGAQNYSDAVTAVASFPILCIGGLLLWRTGRVLAGTREAPAGQSYFLTIVALIARACVVIGIVGPVLAAFGYVAAGKALILPAIVSLGLLTVLMILQSLFSDIWTVLSRADDALDREGLVPVLLGFVLVVASLPLFALIWGARLSDLTELWTRFREGFQMGDTRISPTDFLIFAAIFAVGYMLTRLFQGALRNTILPRTRMERGGQNALVSGTGYVGIFLSAVLAINAAGIDLTGLAIVASALSVGIGFGLQNIVQNFVSGIILMIERPVSEGDWIQVGATQGIVKSISVRSTRIQTFDRNVVVVPNGDLVSQSVTNWTRFSLAGRLIIPIGVAYGTDTRRVEKVLREIAEAQPMVILNPPPVVLFQGFGANSMDFELRVILRDVNFSGQVKTEVNHQIVERFAAEGIEIPFAQSDITLRNVDDLAHALDALRQGLAAAPAPERAAADAPAARPAAGTGPSAEETT